MGSVMKRYSSLCFALSLVACLALPVQAQPHESPFGFKIDLPEGWSVVNPQDMKKSLDAMGNVSDVSQDLDPQVMEEVKERIAASELEYYLRKKGGTLAFVDNVNVTKGEGKIPQTTAHAKKECDVAPLELGRFLGKGVMVFECGLKDIAGHNAMYVDFEGMSKGVRSLSYRIQWTPEIILTFTATCKTEHLDEVKKEFEGMLATLR